MYRLHVCDPYVYAHPLGKLPSLEKGKIKRYISKNVDHETTNAGK